MTGVNETVAKVLARWAEPDGIPFKGELVTDDGCMCAQGQLLHYGAGWSVEDLRDLDQSGADREVARVADISKAHAVLLRHVNDEAPGAPSSVLTDPASVLGDQAATVLAFWRQMDIVDNAAARAAAGDAAGAAARAAAWAAARAAARAAAGDAARAAAWAAAGDAAWDAARDAAWAAAGAAAGAAAWATNEIQGARVMRERGRPFFFLPMFGFADPEAVLAADRRMV